VRTATMTNRALLPPNPLTPPPKDTSRALLHLRRARAETFKNVPREAEVEACALAGIAWDRVCEREWVESSTWQDRLSLPSVRVCGENVWVWVWV
jgi:hypothetical protein